MIFTEKNWKRKPNGAYTYIDLSNAERINGADISDEQFILNLSKGKSMWLDELKPGAAVKKENVIGSYYVAIDFDNGFDYYEIFNALDEIKLDNWYVTFETFSSTKEKLKCRIIYRFDEMLDVDELNFMYEYIKNNLTSEHDEYNLADARACSYGRQTHAGNTKLNKIIKFDYDNNPDGITDEEFINGKFDHFNIINKKEFIYELKQIENKRRRLR